MRPHYQRKEVPIEQLYPCEDVKGIYDPRDYQELQDEIEFNRFTSDLIVRELNNKYEVIGGFVTLEIARELGYKTLWVIIIEANTKLTAKAFRVISNCHKHSKSYREKANEVEIMREYFGKRQGKRRAS